jgi:hypothetical protein
MRWSACLSSPFLLSVAVAVAGAGCEDPAARTTFLRTPTGNASGYATWNTGGPVPRLLPEVCEKEVLTPEFKPLNEEALISFLEKHNYKTRTIRARRDLVYVDVLTGSDDFVRLRVAILPNPSAAGNELHEAILDHGPGSWGIHRSNLAVLAPIGSYPQIVTFASESKLSCWGVLTVAGLDDTMVIPGGYMEL